MPLKVGNSWAYTRTDYDSTGALISSHPETTVVVRDTIIEGYTWYVLQGTFFQNGLFTNKPNGLWQRWDTVSFRSLPMQVNDSCAVIYGFISLIDSSRQVSVPAGSFNCKYYLYRFPDLDWHVGYAFSYNPHIGMVKTEAYSPFGTKYLQYDLRLVNYRLY